MKDNLVLSTNIVTRGYELSSSGIVPASAYLRYLEHMRWQTMTSDGSIPVRRFWNLGVVRAQSLEVMTDVAFHVELKLTLWLSRVGRTSFDFSHTIERVSDGALVALSTATVVALDAARRPTPVSEEAHAYVTQGPTPSVGRAAPLVAKNAWETALFVRPSDQDLQQHVNHARYADFFEDVRVTCCLAGGYGEGSFETPLRKLRLEYEREARFGMSLTGRTARVPGTDRDLSFELEDGQGGLLCRAAMTVL